MIIIFDMETGQKNKNASYPADRVVIQDGVRGRRIPPVAVDDSLPFEEQRSEGGRRIPLLFWGICVVFLLVGITIPIAYFMLKDKVGTPSSEHEISELVRQVGKLIVLPDENPTIATVSDPERLRDKPFFANAQTGYKVLIFNKAKKAILYDPVSHKIVEVAPVNFELSGK